MYRAIFTGQAGLYKNQEYELKIGVINGWIHVRRKVRCRSYELPINIRLPERLG
jgi:hypothetical protein